MPFLMPEGVGAFEFPIALNRSSAAFALKKCLFVHYRSAAGQGQENSAEKVGVGLSIGKEPIDKTLYSVFDRGGWGEAGTRSRSLTSA